MTVARLNTAVMSVRKWKNRLHARRYYETRDPRCTRNQGHAVRWLKRQARRARRRVDNAVIFQELLELELLEEFLRIEREEEEIRAREEYLSWLEFEEMEQPDEEDLEWLVEDLEWFLDTVAPA